MKFSIIIFHIFSILELLTMSVIANISMHYTAITDDFELYVQKLYQEECATEINSDPPSTSLDPAAADPSLRLQICEEISRSGVFAYYEKRSVEMDEEMYYELQQPKYSDIFNHIYSLIESQNTTSNIPHKYDNPYKWLKFKVRGHSPNFYNEHVFVCLLRRTDRGERSNDENYFFDDFDDVGYPSDEDYNDEDSSGEDSNGKQNSNFISEDSVSEGDSFGKNSASEDSDGADIIDEAERETNDEQDTSEEDSNDNRNCNDGVVLSEKDSSRKNTISEDSNNKANVSDEEEFQWKTTASENSNAEETDDAENVDTGHDRMLSLNDEYLSAGDTVGSDDVLIRNEVNNVNEDIASSSDEDSTDSLFGALNRFLEAIGGSDEDVAGVDIYGDSGNEGSWRQSVTSDDDDDDDNGEDSNIIPFYVSKIYNSHRGLGAHRFVFTKERRSRMMLAERPAKINSRPDFNVELHYLELRKRYEPVTSCEEDPVCKLKDSIQLSRLCALVLTSSFFKGKITYPIEGQQNMWIVREVSFRTEEGLAEAAEKSYHEIMVRCYAETVRGRTIKFFDISRAYRPNEVFVYSTKHIDKWYLENLSTNLSMVHERYNFGDVEI